MTERLVEYDVDVASSCAVITLCRPAQRNALGNQMVSELLTAVQHALDDDAVRSLVLTGAGDRAFCAGADLTELRHRDHLTETGPVSGQRRELSALLESAPKPSIAALNGHAVGGGLELALACTFRIAVPHAKLGLPEVGLGIIPGNGGTQRLGRLVGLGRALEMVLTGVLVDAAYAERIGLVNTMVDSAELLPEAHRWAALLAGKPFRALAAAKETVMMSGDVPITAGLGYENKWFALLCSSPEKMAIVDNLMAGS